MSKELLLVTGSINKVTEEGISEIESLVTEKLEDGYSVVGDAQLKNDDMLIVSMIKEESAQPQVVNEPEQQQSAPQTPQEPATPQEPVVEDPSSDPQEETPKAEDPQEQPAE